MVTMIGPFDVFHSSCHFNTQRCMQLCAGSATKLRRKVITLIGGDTRCRAVGRSIMSGEARGRGALIVFEARIANGKKIFTYNQSLKFP